MASAAMRPGVACGWCGSPRLASQAAVMPLTDAALHNTLCFRNSCAHIYVFFANVWMRHKEAGN